MHADVIVVGGGLSGLTAAWQLHRHGVDVLLIESRPRLGGRVLTRTVNGGHYDMGPSWIWHAQPHVAGLVRHFGLEVYEQFTNGELLHQTADGRVHRDAINRPMHDALRIRGGVRALVDAMAGDLPDERVRLQSTVEKLCRLDDGSGPETQSVARDKSAPASMAINVTDSSGERTITADHVALAVPLRLAAELHFEPSLNDEALERMGATPTWMAGHAKFLAVYDTPFWRKQGLSGSALSRRGPLAEIHDASMSAAGPFALFGFFGIDAISRDAHSTEQLTVAATQQLAELFGSAAASPVHAELMDWSTEPFTAAATDRKAPDHHPEYGVDVRLGEPWEPALDFIVSETARHDGGLIDGAIARGSEFAAAMIHKYAQPVDSPSVDQETSDHFASMSWDWISSSDRTK